MSKLQQYDRLVVELRELLAEERNRTANAANTAALVYGTLENVNWVGFYFAEGQGLVVGPFQGKPACTRIGPGQGVCGTAAARRKTVVVPDVHCFPGHVACDAASRSEIVVPILVGERLVGVFDLDSPLHGRFDDADRAGLERIVETFVERTDLE